MAELRDVLGQGYLREYGRRIAVDKYDKAQNTPIAAEKEDTCEKDTTICRCNPLAVFSARAVEALSRNRCLVLSYREPWARKDIWWSGS